MSQLLDKSVLESWNEIDPENGHQIARELIEIFIQSAIPQYLELVRAYDEIEFTIIREQAHSLKSSCGNVGAIAASKIFAELEHAARTNNLRHIEEKFEDIEWIFYKTVSQLETFKPPPQAL